MLPEQPAILEFGALLQRRQRRAGFRVYGGRIVGPDMQLVLQLQVVILQAKHLCARACGTTAHTFGEKAHLMVRHAWIEHADVFFEGVRLVSGAWRTRSMGVTVGTQQAQGVDSRRSGRRIGNHLTPLVALERTFTNGRLQRLTLTDAQVQALALAVGQCVQQAGIEISE